MRLLESNFREKEIIAMEILRCKIEQNLYVLKNYTLDLLLNQKINKVRFKGG